MSGITQTVTIQVTVMYIMVIAGYILTKCSLISKRGAADMSNILLTIVTPCVLIKAYQTKLDLSSLGKLGAAFAASMFIHAVAIVIAAVCFRRVKDRDRRTIDEFSTVYSNCGFMGIPLLEAVFGSKGAFYGSAYLAVFNILAWTHGISMYGKNGGKISLKKLFLNPGVIGTLIALVLYLAQISLPGPVNSVVDYVAGLNTPLAMLLLGSFLARAKILAIFKDFRLYAVSALKLAVCPLIAIGIFYLLGADKTMSISIVISAACPSATLAALFAEKYEMDAPYASQLASVTTIFSIVTVPLTVHFAEMIIK